MAPNKQHVIRLSCPASLAYQLSERALQEMGAKIKSSNPAQGLIHAQMGGPIALTSVPKNVVVQVEAGGAIAPNESIVSIVSELRNTGARFSIASNFDITGSNKKSLAEFEQRLNALMEQASRGGEIQKHTWRPSV